MAKTKLRDTDYLYLTARIRALEGKLLTADRIDRMLEAQTTADAVKILSECGYPEADDLSNTGISRMIAEVREKTFYDLGMFAPDRRIIDLFRIRYDYHNAKVLLRSEALKTDASRLLLSAGRVPAEKMSQAVLTSELSGLPGRLGKAVAAAREVLGTTRDPQKCDFVLDTAYYEDMRSIAAETGSEFIEGYVRVSIDAANLKTAVRVMRIGKDEDFLNEVVIPGGSVELSRIRKAAGGNLPFTDVFSSPALKDAAEAAAPAAAGGDLSAFEKLCDDALTKYLASAKYVAFGEAPFLNYLAERETEYANIRILLLGREAGLPADVLRARMRML